MSESLVASSEDDPGRPLPLMVGDLMVVLGDSLAVGIGAGHVSDSGMAQLASRLAERNRALTMVNLAMPSEGSISMVAPGGQLARAVDTITGAHGRGHRVGPITLCVGANDSIESAILGEAEAFRRFERNLETILVRLDDAIAGQGDEIADVLCVQTFYNPFAACERDPSLPAPDQLAPRRARTIDFNAAIRGTAARHRVRVADVETAFRGHEVEFTWLLSGDIHPNAKGQAVIRDTFIDAGGW